MKWSGKMALALKMSTSEIIEDVSHENSLVMDILNEDVEKIAKSKFFYISDYDYSFKESQDLLKKQILKKHLPGIQRIHNAPSSIDCLKLIIRRLLNNIRNITTNNKYVLYCNPVFREFDEFETEINNDDFNQALILRDLEKIDQKDIKKGLIKISEDILDLKEDFDFEDFSNLCIKFGFESSEIIGFGPEEVPQMEPVIDENGNFQMILIFN